MGVILQGTDTYPTFGNGKSSSKSSLGGDMLVPRSVDVFVQVFELNMMKAH